MGFAFGLLTIGTWLIYSGLKGLSMVEVLAGKKGKDLSGNPDLSIQSAPGAFDPDSGVKGNGTVEELFYDPLGGWDNGKSIGAIGGHLDHVHVGSRNPVILQLLKLTATRKFKLKISSEKRNQPGSMHHTGEAFDAVGSPSDMRAFTRFVKERYV